MRQVNVNTVKLDATLDAAGFRHSATPLTRRFGQTRIGAGLYEAQAGAPIWPYHYHHGVEEWLFVLSGAPVLREPAGRRTLAAGDLIVFPSGRLGAHTVEGPGRFVIFSEGDRRTPRVGVFPDSDKVSGPEGMVMRQPAVGYWHGEGTGELDGEPLAPWPLALDGPPRPVVNLDTVSATPPDPESDTPEGYRHRTVKLGPRLGGAQLGATLYEIEPGQGTAPYHYEYGCEEAVFVLSGSPTLRHPDGEDPLVAGDFVCFPEGPAGAHRLTNHGTEVVRLIILSTKGWPCSVYYPDSGKWVILNGPDEPALIFRSSDAVGLWEG